MLFQIRMIKKDTNLRMNSTLEDMIKGKYNLIKTDSDYKNSADIRDTVELIKSFKQKNRKVNSWIYSDEGRLGENQFRKIKLKN